MKEHTYQENYTKMSGPRKAMYDVKGRSIKAGKILAALEDFLGDISHCYLLDIGCSTGVITNTFFSRVKETVGIDIDRAAVKYANETFGSNRVKFLVQDALNTGFLDGSFEIIICNQIYEHVPDAAELFQEIFRLLKPGGVCYLGATNRLKFMESHYGLPFLSVIPKWIAHLYLRITNKGSHYYETHLTLWGLRKLAALFEITDYTTRILEEPERFQALDLVKSGSMRQKTALFITHNFYWLSPGYVWLLVKSASPGNSDEAGNSTGPGMKK